MLSVAISFAVLSLASSSDYSCTSSGGQCLDKRYYVCTAGYVTDMCDGDEFRQCCQDCDNACQSLEAGYAQGDGECNSEGMSCLDNTNWCYGYYQTGMCGGPSERQCCFSPTCTDGDCCYGNICEVDTTGASCATSSQDNLGYCGAPASHSMAANDFSTMANYKDLIETAAEELCMDASVIAGIISRESRAGNALDANGYGYDGHGYGLMQVDDRYHTLQGGPYSLAHIEQGTGILIGMVNTVQANHPTWSQDMALKGGLSAYNAGASNVQSYENMDVGTTGDDYGNDVAARSQYYKNHGY